MDGGWQGFQMTLRWSKDSEWCVWETFQSHTPRHAALNLFTRRRLVSLCSADVDVCTFVCVCVSGRQTADTPYVLGRDWQLSRTSNECQWDVRPDACVCACLWTFASTGSSLAVPLCQAKNQSACQPSNTFGLLRYLSLAPRVCVSSVILSTSLSLHPSDLFVVLFFFFFLSVLLSGPRCLCCVWPAASNLLCTLNLSSVTPVLKMTRLCIRCLTLCYPSVLFHIHTPNYLLLLLPWLLVICLCFLSHLRTYNSACNI